MASIFPRIGDVRALAWSAASMVACHSDPEGSRSLPKRRNQACTGARLRTEGTGVSRTADLVSRFASFSDMADAVGKIFPRMYTNLHELWDVRALAWSADLVSRFASFRDMADAVGKIFPRMYTNGATSSQL